MCDGSRSAAVDSLSGVGGGGVALGAARARARCGCRFGRIESYREFTLPNGLRVVIAVDHRVPQVALRIEYAVGEALDPPEQRGLAQLIGVILPKLQTQHLRAVERPRLLQAAGFKFEEPGCKSVST